MKANTRRIVKTAAVALAAAVALWLARCAWRAWRRATYREELREAGFPEDYAERLAELKLDHAKWRFEPLKIADMTWKEIADRECEPAVNLVVFANWAPEPWNWLGTTNYTPYYAENAKPYDSGAWYQASRETVEYFMDPRNFMNEKDVFMFETLEHDAASQTREAVERALAGTFMANANYDGGGRRFSELVTEVGRKTGTSPVFIAGRLASEQGGGSVQAFGTIGDALFAYATNETGRVGNADVWGKRFTKDNENTAKALARGRETYNGYYNFFNFRACGRGTFEIKYNAWAEATSEETRAKYLGPWNTQERAIEGGAIKIKERYIDTHRHTRYLQKFSVLAEAGAFRWKQYMQNIAAPLAEARNTARAYEAAGTLDAPYRFLVPIYREMPREPSADPAKGRSVYSPSR